MNKFNAKPATDKQIVLKHIAKTVAQHAAVVVVTYGAITLIDKQLSKNESTDSNQ